MKEPQLSSVQAPSGPGLKETLLQGTILRLLRAPQLGHENLLGAP